MSQRPVETALSQGPCPSFLKLASRYLGEYLDKIRRATEPLDDEQIWWRPASGTNRLGGINSIGNLLVHLCGNLSLWIGAGVGGESVDRDRTGEFKADHTASGPELVEQLAEVVARCQGVLAARDGEPLEQGLDIQGYETDLLGAVFHAVEHMGYHTGQIVFIAKERLGEGHGIEFYPRHLGE